MRREVAAGGAPPVGTLDPAIGSDAVGADIEKAWAYAINLSGGSAPVSGGAGGSSGKPKKGLSISLTIEPLGGGVLLAVRQS